MVKFQEVIRQFHRMCKSGNCIEIKTCPLMKKPNAESCIMYAFENPCDFENIVMAWAAEHPEPVYPTWLEWLESLGFGIAYRDGYDTNGVDGWAFSFNEAEKPIPADLAQKLGIKPKEE